MYSVLTQTVVVATSNSSPMAGYTLCAAICTALLSRQVVVDFWAGTGSAIGSTCGCEWEGESKVLLLRGLEELGGLEVTSKRLSNVVV